MDFRRAKRRLLVLGYNATLTTSVEAPRQPTLHFDQIQVLWPLHACAYWPTGLQCSGGLYECGLEGRCAHSGPVCFRGCKSRHGQRAQSCQVLTSSEVA